MPECPEDFEHACYKVEGKDMTVTISNETITLVKQGDTWVPKVPDGDAAPNEAAQAAEAQNTLDIDEKTLLGKLDGGARRKRRSNKRKPKKSAKKPKRSKKGKTRKQKK